MKAPNQIFTGRYSRFYSRGEPMNTLRFVVFVLTVFIGGCENRDLRRLVPTTSTAPAPSMPSAPVPGPQTPTSIEVWGVTVTAIGPTGPERCVEPSAYYARAPWNGTITIGRSDDAITIHTVHDNYVGTVIGGDFLATEAEGEESSYWMCGGVRVPARVQYEISGRFHDAGRTITAKEITRHVLVTGEIVEQHWDWRGTKQ